MHLIKCSDGYEFVPNISILLDGRWNEKTTEEFLDLLNDFYEASDWGYFMMMICNYIAKRHRNLLSKHTPRSIWIGLGGEASLMIFVASIH